MWIGPMARILQARPSRVSTLKERTSVAVSAFPDELFQCPRNWAERAYPNLIHYNKPDKVVTSRWEQPQLFATELRAGFKPLRGDKLTAFNHKLSPRLQIFAVCYGVNS